MESPNHPHSYPGIPDSPDSASPIPDEYACRNKGDVVDKRQIPREVPAAFGSDAFPIYNITSLNLHSTSSQPHDWQRQPKINENIPTQQPSPPISEKDYTLSNYPPTSEQHLRTEPALSQSRPGLQGPTRNLSTSERTAIQVSGYNTSCTQTRSQHFGPSSKQNMATSPESKSQSSSDRSMKPSVKHLTCWWWYEKGQCRYSESECLYAHHDTGLVADAPRQIKPGEPALAGRSLDRALRQAQQESSPVEEGLAIGELGGSPGKTSIQEENRYLRSAYVSLFAATSHFLETNTHFRQAFNKFFHEVQSLDKASSTAMCSIEQKSLESAAAEWNTRAKISMIENMLGHAGMEDLVQSARKLATQQKRE